MNAFLRTAPLLAAALLAAGASRPAHADVITDWNDKACAIVAKVGQGAPGHRLMAIVQGAVFEAVNAIAAPHFAHSRVAGRERHQFRPPQIKPRHFERRKNPVAAILLFVGAGQRQPRSQQGILDGRSVLLDLF